MSKDPARRMHNDFARRMSKDPACRMTNRSAFARTIEIRSRDRHLRLSHAVSKGDRADSSSKYQPGA